MFGQWLTVKVGVSKLCYAGLIFVDPDGADEACYPLRPGVKTIATEYRGTLGASSLRDCHICQYECFMQVAYGLKGLLGGIADFGYCDRCYRSVVCPSVCMSSVTLVHPAKAVGWNKMPFGRDTRVVPSNIVLDMVRGDLGVGTPSSQRCCLSPNYFGRPYDLRLSQQLLPVIAQMEPGQDF